MVIPDSKRKTHLYFVLNVARSHEESVTVSRLHIQLLRVCCYFPNLAVNTETYTEIITPSAHGTILAST